VSCKVQILALPQIIYTIRCKGEKQMIYVVTTIHRKQEDKHQRTVGYYFRQEHAIQAVVNNICDIYEHAHYNYAVIEAVEEGLYQYDLDPLWFYVSAERTDNGIKYDVKQIKPPEFSRNLVGFGIG
jgi:hypothetical protein